MQGHMTKAIKKTKTKPKSKKTSKPLSVADILRKKKEEADKKNEDNGSNKTLNDFKKNGLENDKNNKEKNLIHEAEYQMFIDFCATPAIYREIENQNEFAKKFKVSIQTLSSWKKRPDFESRYVKALKEFVRKDLVGQSIASLSRQILKEGKAPEVKLMLQLAGVLEEKSSVKVETDSGLTPEQEAGFADRLRRWKNENLKV